MSGAQGERDADDPLRLVGRLTGGVLHDLNNYLNVLGVSLHMYDRAPTPALREEIGLALDHATALTATVLAHLRDDQPELEPVDLAAIAREAMQLAGRAISPEITVVTLGFGVEAIVRGLAPQLGQLVMNLALNAAEAMPGGGTLAVSVAMGTDRTVRLAVSDTGRGISVDAKASGAWTPSTKRGRGLGLGIVRGVVKLHGATFEIGAAQGGGTLATVTFPA